MLRINASGKSFFLKIFISLASAFVIIAMQSEYCAAKVSDDTLQTKEITAGNYRILLENSESDFFTGKIKVENRKGENVFSAEGFYSGYNSDTLVDLNADGVAEEIIDLRTGVNMYNYNMLLIFDFTKADIEPLEVRNAELKFPEGHKPLILSYERLSPAVMGAGYMFALEYKDGKILLAEPEGEEMKKILSPDDKEDRKLIKEYSEAFDECAKDSEVIVYFQANLMQRKISGEEEEGWRFFDDNYNCRNKNKIRKELKKFLNESFSYIGNSANYKFAGGE